MNVFNRIVITGDPSELDSFLLACQTDGSNCNLTLMLPPPDGLTNDQLSEWKQTNWSCPAIFDAASVTRETPEKLIIDVGTIDSFPLGLLQHLSRTLPLQLTLLHFDDLKVCGSVKLIDGFPNALVSYSAHAQNNDDDYVSENKFEALLNAIDLFVNVAAG